MTEVRLLFDQRRIHVMRRATIRRQFLLLLALNSESKVNNLDFIGRVDEDVVELEVPMYNLLAMHEGNAFDYLFEYLPYIEFRQARLRSLIRLLNQMVQALSFTQFHN